MKNNEKTQGMFKNEHWISVDNKLMIPYKDYFYEWSEKYGLVTMTDGIEGKPFFATCGHADTIDEATERVNYSVLYH
jgi:hypothetical protein